MIQGKVIFLWNVVNWSNRSVVCINDNTFVFNRMLGNNTVFCDIRTTTGIGMQLIQEQ